MLLIELAFPAGRYHATAWGRHVNEGIPEWPPSAYRLIRALYDVWKRKLPEWEESRMERLLGTLGSAAPCYRLPSAAVSHTRSYLSENKQDVQSKALVFDGFVVLSSRATVLMGWPDLAPDSRFLEDLDELLSRLNYLGRSESWIEARTLRGVSGVEWNCFMQPREPAKFEMDIVPVAAAISPNDYKPVAIGRGKTLKHLTWMEAIATGTDVILGAGWSHPPAMRYVDYLRPADCFAPEVCEARQPKDLRVCSVLYALDSKVPPDVTETLEVAERVRTKLMGIHKRLAGGPQHVSIRFSGKDRGGEPLQDHRHAFYLPLDNNGDGRLDHLLVHCREGFDPLERQTLDEFGSLWQGGGRPDVRCIPVHWGGGRSKKKKVFASASPFVPTRYYRPGRGDFGEWLHAEIARECDNHGIPRPACVTGIRELIANGVRPIRWSDFRRNRKLDRARSGFGVRLEFDEPIDAPFALGYGCHFGLGLFRAVE
jgi:CRISPR-associated protein Csb2